MSWIIGSASGNEHLVEPTPSVPRRERFAQRLRNYTIAALLVLAAAAIRGWLAPYLGQLAPFPPFLMAIAVAAWIGGMGPGAFATALALPIVWMLFLHSSASDSTGERIAVGLFAATALAASGVTAALRVMQSRVNTLSAEIAARQAALDESEMRFRQLADRSAKLIWMSAASRHRAFFNHAWCAFTGRSLQEELGVDWISGVHPEDRERCVAQIGRAHDERDPFTLEYRLRRHDGVYRRILDHGRPRVMPDGRFAGFVGEGEDVTDLPLALRRLAHSATATSTASRDNAGTVE